MSHVSLCYYKCFYFSHVPTGISCISSNGEMAVSSTARPCSVLQMSQLAVTANEVTVVFYAHKDYQDPPVSLSVPAHAGSPFCPVKDKKENPGLFIFAGDIAITKSLALWYRI